MWLFAVAFLGQIDAPPPVPANDDKAVVLKVEQDRSGCLVTIKGETYRLPFEDHYSADAQRLEATLKALAEDKSSLHIVAGKNVQYRCVGGIIYVAQAAGMPRIGFISEPPPKRK